ncbi:MAG: M15 family metallopeptidase [Clostridia bacterium]|nr:M15 family metallopeptidase [Clostridia bacterium]
MRRCLAVCLIGLLMIGLTGEALAAEPLKTAAELFAANPHPDVPLSSDPYMDATLWLVNKENALPYDYVPELRTVDVRLKPGLSAQQLRPEAASAVERLFADAEAAGYQLAAVSGYRSYITQKGIHARKVAQKGKATAELSSAPPGKSEHQLGLAIDISCASINYRLNAIFGDTDEGKWLYEHCWEYGFIIRYKPEWQKITGYKSEPWHIRYIGKEHARLVTQLNVPYETYMEYLSLCWKNRDRAMTGAIR